MEPENWEGQEPEPAAGPDTAGPGAPQAEITAPQESQAWGSRHQPGQEPQPRPGGCQGSAGNLCPARVREQRTGGVTSSPQMGPPLVFPPGGAATQPEKWGTGDERWGVIRAGAKE